jgi:hypothetical protein
MTHTGGARHKKRQDQARRGTKRPVCRRYTHCVCRVTQRAPQAPPHCGVFCDAHQAWQIQLSTDNKPLLQRIIEYQQYKTYFPDATSNAEWDIVQAISTTCAKMHIVPFFCHVKGYQDDKTAYGNLPLEAQLNVDADYEAGSYYQMHPNDDTPVWLIPGTCANLTTNANTISGYKQVIRTASTAPPLLAKIQEHNGWTTHDMSRIHRTALDRAT